MAGIYVEVSHWGYSKYPDALKDPKNGPPPQNDTHWYIGETKGIIAKFHFLDPKH